MVNSFGPDPQSRSANIGVVSASLPLRQALTDVIGHHPALNLVGAYPSIQTARAQLLSTPVDVAVSTQPPANLGEVQLWRDLHDAGIATLMLSPNTRDRDSVWSVLAGVSGFMPGIARAQAISGALVELAGGGTILPTDVFRRLSNLAAGASPSPLRVDERTLLALVLERRTTQDVAARMQISAEDVRLALESICGKLA